MTHDASLTSRLLDHLRFERRDVHRRVLTLADDLTDDQLYSRPGAHAPSIGFHVWHLARWEDYDRTVMDGTPQSWHARDLARAWGFPSGGLGEADTGTEMGDDASGRLVLPGKAALLDYARSAFAATDELLEQLPAESLLQVIALRQHGDDVVSLVFAGMTHDNCHLGMIEAVRGLLGLHGTATR